MLNSKDINNWNYLVAAVKNPTAGYINAMAKRYARAILAVDAEMRRLKNLDSNLPDVVLDNGYETPEHTES